MSNSSIKEYVIYFVNKNVLKKLEIKILEEYCFIGAFLVEMNNEQLKKINKITDRVFCSCQEKVKSQIREAKKFIGISKFYAQGYYGKNITVAIIDTGVEPILDLCVPINRILKFIDFTDKSKVNPYDDNGHGTFISGIIASNGLLSFGEYAGVAPLCNLIVLKALNSKGEGLSSTILEAMNWIAKNRKIYSIKVACLSFGSEVMPENDALSLGARMLWENGIVVVSAGGNDGPNFGTVTSPGICNQIITVGALDKISQSLKVADYSSRGNLKSKNIKPDIIAPGTEIISNSNKIGEKNYVSMSGTSVSTPIIAGVCALFCEKYPNYSPNQIKSKLLQCAVDIGENKYAQGKGAFIYR